MKKLLLIFIFLPLLAHSQQFEVNLSVSADNVIRDRALSILSRLLREFDEVTLSDSYFSDYEIRIIIIETKKSGYVDGYAASLVVLKPLHPNGFTYAIADKYVQEFNKDNIDFIKIRNKKLEIDTSYISKGLYEVFLQNDDGIYVPKLQNLLIDYDLESLCERIVATIDVGIFEPKRKMHDNLWKD